MRSTKFFFDARSVDGDAGRDYSLRCSGGISSVGDLDFSDRLDECSSHSLPIIDDSDGSTQHIGNGWLFICCG